MSDSRAVLVTGGSRGIGRAIAHAFAAAGDRVAVHWGASRERAEAVLAELPGDGHVLVQADLADAEAVGRMVDEAAAALGGLDVLVNNAGVFTAHPPLSVSYEEWQAAWSRTLAVNLLGAANATFRAVPHLVAAGGGAIVNVSSVAATIAFPGIAGYSGTKSAVDRMTRIAAAEAGRLGYGVRVNCIYPGLVPTAMGMQLAVDCAELGLFESPEAAVGAVVGLTPSGRLGEVADMADAVVFLASDAARFVNGTGLSVDGGMGS